MRWLYVLSKISDYFNILFYCVERRLVKMGLLKRRSLLASVIIVAIALVAGIAFIQTNQQQNTIQAETPAGIGEKKEQRSFLSIPIRTVDGEEITIGGILEEKKRPVVLYFFATWCPTCRSDLKNLKTVYNEFKEDVEVIVVGFDLSESVEEIREYAVKRGYYGLWTFTEPSGDLIASLKVTAMASKIIISPDGEVVYREGYGVVDEARWRSILSTALA